jgi:hypothetical protein
MEDEALRWLKLAVAVMGVLIVAGLATIAVVITGRMSGASGGIASAVLDEPAGTRIVGASISPDRMAIRLEGGGPDRVVMVDTKVGRVLSRVSLAR